jgi:SAM-dependent methyltransferase
MQIDILREYLCSPQNRSEIIREFCSGKRVLDIGCVHHDIENSERENWIHGVIVACAEYVLGVDYLESAVAELASKGFNVITADVTKPIPITDRFDVIVVGNLIEHLSSFEGLMENIQKLLLPGGVALISTANPFYREQYFFSAFKNDVLINPEHTCWIDPVALEQLSVRFGLKTAQVRWVKEKWPLSAAIFHGRRQQLNMFTGRWVFQGEPNFSERLLSKPFKLLLRLLPQERRVRVERRYGNDLGRFVILRVKAAAFEFLWRLYRPLVITSDLNKHELFVSVLERTKLNAYKVQPPVGSAGQG